MRPSAALVLLTALGLGLVPPASAEGLRLSYSMGWAPRPVTASAVDPGFEDLPSWGHSSSFSAAFPLGLGFSWLVAPGAANFEPGGRTQYSYQDNLVGVDFRTEGAFFVAAGAGLGGALVTLSTKAAVSDDPTTALVYRASSFLWSGWLGIGWRPDAVWSVALQADLTGFFDGRLAPLATPFLGIEVQRSLR